MTEKGRATAPFFYVRVADLRQRLVGVIASGSSLISMIAGLPLAARPLEGRREVGGRLHCLAMAAIGAGQGGEIGVFQVGRDNAAREFALLMHADGAVDAVVDDDDDDRQVVLHRGREFLAVHLEASVAGEGDDLALRETAPWRRRRRACHSPSSRRSARPAWRSGGSGGSGAPRSRSCRRHW